MIVMIARQIQRHPLITIWWLALLIRAVYVVRSPDVFFGDAVEYDAMARSLLAGQGLGVEAVGFVRPPLYPIFVAVCYVIGGMVAVQVAQVVIGAFTSTLIGLLARQFSSNSHGVWGAALLAAAYPWFIQWVGSLATETLFTFFAVATFIAALWVARHGGTWSALGTGLLLGTTSLIRGNFLLLAPAVALLLFWKRRGVMTVSLVALGAVLALAPFTALYLAQGYGLMVGSGSGGIAFYVGNNPTAASLFRADISDDEWRTLNSGWATDPTSLAFLGCETAISVQHCADHLPVAQRDRFFYEAGFRYIRSEPAEWADMTAKKVVRQWTPWVEPRAYPLSIVVVSGASFIALLVLTAIGLRGIRSEAVALLIVIAIAVTVTSALSLVQLRYRFPLLDPALIAASGAPFERLVRRALSAVGR